MPHNFWFSVCQQQQQQKRKKKMKKNHHNLITNRKGKCWADSLAKLEILPLNMGQDEQTHKEQLKLKQISILQCRTLLTPTVYSDTQLSLTCFHFHFFPSRSDWQRILFTAVTHGRLVVTWWLTTDPVHCGHTRSAGRYVVTDNGSCSLRSHTVGWSLRGDWQRILFTAITHDRLVVTWWLTTDPVHCGHTRSVIVTC